MKLFGNLTQLLLGLSLSLGTVAAETVYTTPSGYVTHNFGVGFTPLGINLHTDVLVSGTFDSQSGGVLTDTDANFAAVLSDTSATYVVELADGTVAEISNINTTSVEVGSGAIAASGAAYKIRKSRTLNEIFGVGAEAKLTSSDIIWIREGADYARYFYRSDAQEFRDFDAPFVPPSKPVALFAPDGIFVQIASTPVEVTIFGSVKSTPNAILAPPGFKLITIPSPGVQKLNELGLETVLATSDGPGIGSADSVWVPQPAGTSPAFKRYYYDATNSVWRDFDAPLAPDQGAIALPSAAFIANASTTVDRTGIITLPAAP